MLLLALLVGEYCNGKPPVIWEIIESQNCRMVWVGRELIDYVVPTSLPWAGTPSVRPDFSKPHPTWSKIYFLKL